MKKSYLFAFSLLLYCSCQSDFASLPEVETQKIILSNEEYKSIASDDVKELSEDDAIRMVKSFETLLKVDSLSTKSADNGTYSVKKKFYLSNETDGIKTKASPASDRESMLVYEIDIDDRVNALVSADSRFPHVITYTNKDTKYDCDDRYPSEVLTQIAQYSALSKLRKRVRTQDSLRIVAKSKIAEVLECDPKDVVFSEIKDRLQVSLKETKATAEEEIYGHIYFQSKNTRTSTTWDQVAPYNRKLLQACSYDSWYEGRYPVGCAVVCIAQVLAHFEPYMYCDGYNINWKYLKPGSIEINAPANKIHQIGALMKYVGDHTNATYSCSGTSMSTGEAIINFLPNYNIITDPEKNMNISSIRQSLAASHIVIMRGNAPGHGRHAWIIDEFVTTQPGYDYGYPDPKIDYMRANMGWGGSYDGYYEIDEDGYLDFNTGSNGVFNESLTCFTNVRRK